MSNVSTSTTASCMYIATSSPIILLTFRLYHCYIGSITMASEIKNKLTNHLKKLPNIPKNIFTFKCSSWNWPRQKQLKFDKGFHKTYSTCISTTTYTRTVFKYKSIPSKVCNQKAFVRRGLQFLLYQKLKVNHQKVIILFVISMHKYSMYLATYVVKSTQKFGICNFYSKSSQLICFLLYKLAYS